jgi:hypothetical protein
MQKILNIGRDDSNQIVLKDPTVSRNHGVLYFLESGQVLFEDLNSLNGSYIQGNRVYGKVEIKRGQILKVGKALVPWQNYLGHTIYDPPEISSPPVGQPPVPPKIENNPIGKYWPVGAALIAIILIGVFIFNGIGNSAGKSEDNVEDSEKKSKVETVEGADEASGNGDNYQNDELNDIPKDSDNDGVYDNQDNCPNQKGPKANQGCPYSDYDNDGIPDRDDDCKYEYGPRWNDGCPEEEYEEESYRTRCPYCTRITYETSTNRWWNCGSCGERFYNCYKSSVGDHDGVRSEWFNDGDCDCYSCADEN